MSELRCPECKHLVSKHEKTCMVSVETVASDEYGVLHCHCNLTEAQALRAAQRKAAIEKLRHMFKQRDSFDKKSVGYDRWDNAAWMVLGAYRAVGILGQRKGGE